MTLSSEHRPNHQFPQHGVEPLPGDQFEPELRAIDALLRKEAADAAREIPARLVDRVYDASVRLLPQAPLRLADAPVRGGRRVRPSVRRQWAGRLAMAASLAFAFAVGSLFVSTPLSQPMTVLNETEGDVVLAAYTDVLSERPQDEQLGHEVSYLLETGALSSYDELTGEMEALIAELEM
jgi:hypothetical protein